MWPWICFNSRNYNPVFLSLIGALQQTSHKVLDLLCSTFCCFDIIFFLNFIIWRSKEGVINLKRFCTSFVVDWNRPLKYYEKSNNVDINNKEWVPLPFHSTWFHSLLFIIRVHVLSLSLSGILLMLLVVLSFSSWL